MLIINTNNDKEKKQKLRFFHCDHHALTVTLLSG